MLAAVLVAVLTVVQAPASGQPPAGDVEQGREVFRANCAMCHGSDAAGMMGMHPSLRGAVQRLTVEGVEVAIRKGRATRPPMPAWEGRLTDEQITDVVAYIASLLTGPRNFGPAEDMMGDDGMMDGDTAGMPAAAVWAAVPLAAVLLAVLLAVVVPRLRRPAGPDSTPREILDRRYAAGELTREEYLRLRDDLEA